VLGNHRLVCGDATVLADVERVLAGQLADMTFCDPPYNVDYANTPKDKLRSKHSPILNDNLGGCFETFLVDACTNVLSVTKSDGRSYEEIAGSRQAAQSAPPPYLPWLATTSRRAKYWHAAAVSTNPCQTARL
jgi:hypothetical protein